MDFRVPDDLRGRRLRFRPEGRGNPLLELMIPANAAYLDINTPEYEDDHQGCHDNSKEQELLYYSAGQELISSQHLEDITRTCRLMALLECLLEPEYNGLYAAPNWRAPEALRIRRRILRANGL